MRLPTPPETALRGVTSAGTRDSYTSSETLTERGWEAPRGGGAVVVIGDNAGGGMSIGREERTSRVDSCCWETLTAKSAAFAFEGEVVPLEDHCLKPWTEPECEKRESWSGSWKRAWLRRVSVRKYGSGT